MSNRNPTWPYLFVLAVCLTGALWYGSDYLVPLFDRLAGKQPEAVVEEAPVERKPRYPLERPAPAPADNVDAIEPLPPLDKSDDYARTALIKVFGNSVDEMLAENDLFYKFVATADSLTTAKPPRKIWPINARLDAFAVVAADDARADAFYPSPDNYQRYDLLVNLATGADPKTLAAAYRRMYPLLQESYISLGYPDGYFNDRLVAVVDHLLRAPETAEPILLVRPHVLYQYADPTLEALSGGQKLLLRMGSANAAKIKQTLRAFRQLIVQPADSPPTGDQGY